MVRGEGKIIIAAVSRRISQRGSFPRTRGKAARGRGRDAMPLSGKRKAASRTCRKRYLVCFAINRNTLQVTRNKRGYQGSVGEA